ncbi:hypothetical protein PQ455_02055 [Sphingomonas naphthae]|uniref:TPM domain-containing protein n=1 Tax=Sphingomonas naphthae TaxID=1813468 RepID=A0ABY7TPC3_9SPHN|nr:hypothetical protein [Sphingomonas naphthae]WCT74039.1 hypothetical protein PQ455_02055 [Sphingomonas naphthae]
MLNAQEQARVTAAVTAAEARTDGEIATIIAERSDDYGDIATWYAVLVLFLALAVVAVWPGLLVWYRGLFAGWEAELTQHELLTTLLAIAALKFGATRLLLQWWPLRLALVPGIVKTTRARAAALRAFRVGTEQRTAAHNGVLVYLSAAEHRAEIVADRGIHEKVGAEEWGEAMAALIAGLKVGKPGDGMVAAVERIGAVLTTHFPRTGDDPNEMPDRLVLL